jgi:hypothetical protein
MFEPDDPLLNLPPEPGDELLRDQLLKQTLRTIHQRWWIYRLQRGLIVVLAFVAGMFVMNFFSTPETETRIVHLPIPMPAKETAPEAKEPPPVEDKPSPADLELQAEKRFVRAEAAQLFRQAGDRYLLDEGNYRAALRCYRNYLDEAEKTELVPATNDTWLLTSLKQARSQ